MLITFRNAVQRILKLHTCKRVGQDNLGGQQFEAVSQQARLIGWTLLRHKISRFFSKGYDRELAWSICVQ